MNRTLRLLAPFLVLPVFVRAAEPSPAEFFTDAVERLAAIIDPAPGTSAQTFTTTLRVLRAPAKEAVGREAKLAYQAPDKLQLSAEIEKNTYRVGRHGGEIWFHVPGKKWGVIGKPGVAKFASDPASIDQTVLPPFVIPHRAKIALLPTLCTFEEQYRTTVGKKICRNIVATPTEATQRALQIPAISVGLAIADDGMPVQITVFDGKKLDIAVEFVEAKLESPWLAEQWQLKAAEGDRIETTAVAHFARGISAGVAGLGSKIPTLPPLDGSRVLLKTEGKGRLELHEGVRVLFLNGTPEEMGHQQGTLVRREVHNLVDRILYGVGVMSSLAKGRWFFGEIEEAQARLQKFMDPRYLRETDAMADAAGLPREELRLANYFPELFHCSGFALLGPATQDGRIFHGRILDYLKGVGLEQNACVVVLKPDEGNAWVNVGYCGFVGSVTAMNEKGISIGEMGGRGEGKWDGKPMAQLVREVMEKCSSLDEAVDLMRRSPRTCEYYYVIADAKAKRAVGVKATPEIFEVVEAGGSHPQLPHPVAGAVLMSAGDRYQALVKRAQAGHGKFDAASARALMTRPVCMSSNIHSVLFAPDTLDFWVANADGQNVASHTEYRKFNLRELLNAAPAPAKGTASR